MNKIEKVASRQPQTETTLFNSIIPLSKKMVGRIESDEHYVIVHPTPYKKQPKGSEMGKITNDIKRRYAERTSIKKILELFGNGHCILLANAEVDENNNFQFLRSRLFAIDIDDDHKIVDIPYLLEKLKDKAVGMFYTFSHGIKGNRFRLIFQLDKPINDLSVMRGIIRIVAEELKDMGLPVDIQAVNPTQIVRGGKGYKLLNQNAFLNTDELFKRLAARKEQRKKEVDLETEQTEIPFPILKEMAEKIGYIPTGSGQGDLWKRLVVAIKHYANCGFITQEQGYELFDIISGGETSVRDWDRMKASGSAKIGSFIHEARERGYTGEINPKYINTPIETNYEHEVIKVDRYIPEEVAAEILRSKKRVLVDSPTGSGKTTAFLNAAKLLVTPLNHFYIFAMPTVSLTRQNEREHGVLGVAGQSEDLFKRIFQNVMNGKRVFISTYDMVPVLVSLLKKNLKDFRYTLIVDELHKFVFDYDYRFQAIRSLYQVSKKAVTFIGLSGTIDEIYKNEFDRVIKIENGFADSPCLDYAVYTYENKKEWLSELIELCTAWSNHRRLLIFIESKGTIDKLQKQLQKRGIKVRAISADSKSNPTYKQLIENQTVDDDVRIILSTSVIADGVNIRNEKDMDWEVIAVCNESSSLFNYSMIKQMSNRLRATYRRFSLFMQEQKVNDESKRFYIESAYRYRYETATRIVDHLIEDPFFDFKLFRKSLIERRFGIYKSEESLEIDTLYIRHTISTEQEHFFAKYRNEFARSVGKVLRKEFKTLNISEEIRKKNLDIIASLEELEAEEREEKEKMIIKAGTLSEVFTKEVYQALKDENEAVWSEFKNNVVDYHYHCIKPLIPLSDHATCLAVAEQVKRKNETHKFYNDIRALIDIYYFQSVNRPSKTKKVLEEVTKLNEFVTTDDFNKLLERIATKVKLPLKDVKAVESMIILENTRTKKERLKRVVGPLTFDQICESHGLTALQVKGTLVNYGQTQSKAVQVVLESKLDRIQNQQLSIS